MILRALFHLQEANQWGANGDQIRDTIEEFYAVVDQNHDHHVADTLRIMLRKRNQFRRVTATRFMFLYGSDMFNKFVSRGAGGGLRMHGMGGNLPVMIEYKYMVLLAIRQLQQAGHPNGSTVGDIAAQIRLMYERLPHSHDFQTRAWVDVLYDQGHLSQRGFFHFANTINSRLLAEIDEVGGGI